jgi:hypothetical protein
MMKTKRKWILFLLLVAAAASSPALATAQNVEHGRGNIVSIDHDRQTVQLRDPQGRTATWRFNSGAPVRFTDGGSFFANPSVRDLRPPMYVHYTFSNEVINGFDVVELGFDPATGNSSSSATKQQGRARTVTGRVTAYDPSVRQVEVEHGGNRETFQLTGSSDTALRAGDRVTLRTDWSGQRELVVEVRRANQDGDGGRSDVSSGSSATTRGTSSRRPEDGSNRGESEGRVVRLASREVVMEVAGSQQTYTVGNSSLMRELRVGDTVQFEWRRDDSGRLYIMDVR